LGVGLTTLHCKKKIVEKPPRNSAGFCGGGQGLSWAVEPRKERKKEEEEEEQTPAVSFMTPQVQLYCCKAIHSSQESDMTSRI
jgi:hypothetical protein